MIIANWWVKKLTPLGFVRVVGKKTELVRWQTELLGQSLELYYSDYPGRNYYVTISNIIRTPFDHVEYEYILLEHLSKEGVIPDGENRFHGWAESETDQLWSAVQNIALPLLEERTNPEKLFMFIKNAIDNGIPTLMPAPQKNIGLLSSLFGAKKKPDAIHCRRPPIFNYYAGILAESLDNKEDAIKYLSNYAESIAFINEKYTKILCEKILDHVRELKERKEKR